MSDFTVPSYRIRPARAGFEVPWKMIAVAGGIAGVLAVVGGGLWWVTRAANRNVPTIEADTRPIRIRPDDPGGLRVANQDERIFDNQRRGGAAAPQAPRLAPEAERPDVAALRQAAATRPATPPAAPAPQPAPAAATAPAVPPGTLVPLRPPGSAPAAVAPQAAPAAPPAAPARPAGRIVVQLGAVSSEAVARAEWERVRARAPDLMGDRQLTVTRVDRGEGQTPLYRMRTGGFDAEGARAFCAGLRAKGAACTVIGNP
ncbi:SPOR domain-containing protein [Muricoccus radiodurans]|uniref:SPOR domain-containing protein n=1 Tax=Muricoccus radiodurans TaxID=2231721 RepID=UPI003CF24F56